MMPALGADNIQFIVQYGHGPLVFCAAHTYNFQAESYAVFIASHNSALQTSSLIFTVVQRCTTPALSG